MLLRKQNEKYRYEPFSFYIWAHTKGQQAQPPNPERFLESLAGSTQVGAQYVPVPLKIETFSSPGVAG